ncbi:hypothetical protein [Bacillus piscicola]|nr:hypothetical protein [Bacillus piscicola]
MSYLTKKSSDNCYPTKEDIDNLLKQLELYLAQIDKKKRRLT